MARQNDPSDAIAEIETLLDAGQVFLAQDQAGEAREAYGDPPALRALHALALIRSGAAAAGQGMLAPLLDGLGGGAAADRRALAALRQMMRAAETPEDATAEEVAAALSAAETALKALEARGGREALSPAALAIIGDALVELWRRAGDRAHLTHARAAFQGAAGARAAAMSRLLALVLGETPPDQPVDDAGPHAPFWAAVARGADALVQGGDALDHFHAARAAAKTTSHRSTILREFLTAYAARMSAPEGLTEIFAPPRVVVFTGVPFDHPGAPPRCAPHLEGPIRDAIRARLDDLGAEVGFSSASCGADILFAEAMRVRGGEVHLVLPFAEEDFVAERVGYLDQGWVRRFDVVRKLAETVATATPGPYLGDDILYRFGNQALHGAATMRARQFGVEPELLTLWDMAPGGEIGDVADFIDRWADMSRLHIIDLDQVREEAGPAPEPDPAATPAAAPPRPKGQREIRALMMSDIVGSSRVGEAAMPAYAGFMNAVAERLAKAAPKPTFANTWGDAIFATSPSALDLADYALALKAAVLDLGGLGGAIDPPLGMRISLNAGPVLETEDQIAGRLGNFGAEIVRAARIEPVTTPNHIYATDAFISLLIAEESEARAAAMAEGQDWASRFQIEYIGRVSLAKNAGSEGLHHLSAAI